MTTAYFPLIIAFVFGFYMAWNIGANDVANSMASAVGAKAITLKQAVVIAGVLNVIGAVFFGSHVTNTIRKGIVSTEVLSNPDLALVGALSAMLSAAIWVSFATWKSFPVSTTHSIVGSMIGFGVIAGGFSVIQWGKLGAVVLSWIISPVFSMVIAFIMIKLIFRLILSKTDSYYYAIRLAPFFIGLAVMLVILSFLFKTPYGKSFPLKPRQSFAIAFTLAVVFGIVGKKLMWNAKTIHPDDGAEQIFRKIQIGTSCYVALAQGANDVANAIAPLAMVYFIVHTGAVGEQVEVPKYLLLFGGIGIACGISMWGYRVMDTIGSKITTLNNTRGYSVDFAAATTVLIASVLGLPVSTTHAAVGGVLGVGLAGGIAAVKFSVVIRIIVYWVLTVPAAALTCIVIYKIIDIFI